MNKKLRDMIEAAALKHASQTVARYSDGTLVEHSTIYICEDAQVGFIKGAEAMYELLTDGTLDGKKPLNSDSDPGDYRIGFGRKYKGLKLRDIPKAELEEYISWLEDNAYKKGLPLNDEALKLKAAIQQYFDSLDKCND